MMTQKMTKMTESITSPEVKFTANIHGNEVVGRELLLALGRRLITNI